MKLALDISQIAYEGTGVARFTRGLVQSILTYDKKNQWVFFFSSLRGSFPSDVKAAIEKRGHHVIHKRIPPSLLSFLWNQLHVLSIETFIGSIDWYISSDWTQGPAKAKKATIIHDLTYLRYPETVTASIRKTQEKRMHWVLKESDLIFADSQTTKDDIIEYLKISSKKIKVNYPGLHESSKQLQSSDLKRFGLRKPFILSVGKIEPRKNLNRLIDAFKSLNQDQVELVIVGPSGWDTLQKQPNVRLLGYVDDGTLHQLYQSCLFFVYPSLWEGFGYPVIEAMQNGAAVATSDVASLKEIAKDVSLLFEPTNTASIQTAMQQLLMDESLRRKLIAEGKKRAAEYTWKRYFETFIDTITSSHG